MYQAKDHTFVICAYKENKYLEECIKSIINQTIKSNVLISTSTPNIYISQLAEKYKIPIIINHGLGDQADNFNFAYRSVKTELVTICHQDDYYAKHYLEYLLKYSNQSKDLLLFFTDYQEVKETKLIKSNKLLKIKRIMLFPLKNKKLRSYQWVRKIILAFGNPICCPSVTYRKQKIHSPVFNSKYKAILDWRAWIKISQYQGEFVYCSIPLVYHRIHEDTGTTETILNHTRTKEEEILFREFWPKPIANFLGKIYSTSQNSNL